MSNQVKIVIVDDHPVVLEGLSNLISTVSDFNLVAKCQSALDALSAIRTKLPDVVLTDIHLPEVNGIELCQRIKSEFPFISVIAISTFQDRSYVSEIIKHGASGYLSKNAEPEEIVSAIRRVLKGELAISQLTPESVLPIFNMESGPVLTRRETEVLQLISEGLTNKEIADRLFVSQSTVDSHRKNLLHKFGVLNTAALIAQAVKSGKI